MLRAIGASRPSGAAGGAHSRRVVVGLVASASRSRGRHRRRLGSEGAAGVGRSRHPRRSAVDQDAARSSSRWSSVCVVTVVSAVLPAREASKVPPIAALRDVALDRSAAPSAAPSSVRPSPALGVGALLAGLAVRARRSSASVRPWCSSASRCSARCSPARLASCSAARWRSCGAWRVSLARQNAMRNPKRTARTAASLMIGVGLWRSSSIFAASAKTSMAGSLEQRLPRHPHRRLGCVRRQLRLQPRARRQRCARPRACGWCRSSGSPRRR